MRLPSAPNASADGKATNCVRSNAASKLELGKPSVTKWRVLERYPTERLGRATSLMELEPKTGRSHQLRVHLKAIGHPIVGDHFYAPNEIAMLTPRLMLHSARLEFTHPTSKARVSFISPQPW